MADETSSEQTSAVGRVSEGLSPEGDWASLHVEQVIVRNFRGIAECQLELEPDLTLLVGRNNAGKSRILRALAIALGAVPADSDDWTSGGSAEPTIDVVIAPRPARGEEEIFEKRVGRRLGGAVQAISDSPQRERFAWRTLIRRSAEGMGVQTEQYVLVFDVSVGGWRLPSQPISVTRDQRTLVAADLVDSRRDLADDLSRRGSPIRRILDDLEVAPEQRDVLEAALSELGLRVIGESASLSAVQDVLDELSRHVDSVGVARISPLPARLEELSRTVVVGFDTGTGDLPIRFHGAGARSLAALQTQGVLYARRLGKDGPALRPHPVSLIEEPEAHLHPQAQFDLAALLTAMRSQVIVSTHSSHLVTAVEPRSIRLLQSDGLDIRVVDLRPVAEDDAATHRARRPSLHLAEMDKLRRLVERPFGELLFASCVVIGDGPTERGLLPEVMRHRLGARASGVVCVDPDSMGSPHAIAVAKFCNLVGMPWFLFADSDDAGKRAAEGLVADHGGDDMERVIWVAPEPGAATECMFLDFDEELVRDACARLGVDTDGDLLAVMTGSKGVLGPVLAESLVKRRPWPEGTCGPPLWPAPLVELVFKVQRALARDAPNDV